MAGFRKDKVAQTVVIAFDVAVTDERTGGTDTTSVVHTFRRPTIKEREMYRQMAHRFEGGKPRLRLTKANLALWDACIESVSGYDDLPKEGDWKSYFIGGDDIGKEHADAAVRILLDKITENETDLEKN